MDKVVIKVTSEQILEIYSERKFGGTFVFRNEYEKVIRKLIERNKNDYEIEMIFDEDFCYFESAIAKELKEIFAEYIKEPKMK